MSDERDWEVFKQKFNAKSGINLNDYKPTQMKRRINNLMTRHGVDTYMGFFNLISADAKLYKSFIDYLTINVTEFFRTPEKFGELESKVLPDLLAKNPKLSIWSAGCSIGAEPYSLAMILQDITPGAKHRILATDLDVEMLAKAQQGAYTANEYKNISPARAGKYFTQNGSQFIIKEDIRSRVEFKKHNLLLDKFEFGFDLILCRNVVIYFTEEAKDSLYRRFLASLKPGGVLFVGGTEAILNFRDIGFEHYLPFFYRKPSVHKS
ncbi:MAG: protein-glutamate O-methyltransferase CheR [Veillonellales bacterium]